MRWLPFAVFLAIALALVGGLHYYAWARLVRDPQLPAWLARSLAALLAVLAVGVVAVPVLARLLQTEAMRPLIWAALLWMGVGFLTVAMLGIADLGRLLFAGAARLAAFFGDRPLAPLDPERRVFLARAFAGGAGAMAAGLSVLGIKSALAAVKVREVPVRLKNLPAHLAGTKLVQISDVHIGPLLRKEWLEGVVERIRALAPDLVAITGDLVDGSVRELEEHVAPLAAIPSRLGTFFVTGNHEYYSGAEAWLRHLPKLGIRPLQNERVRVCEGLEIAGINDLSARGRDGHAPDLDKALAGRDTSCALVLLAHQPRQFGEAARKGVDLTLSGHTHGGQIWPFSWLVALTQPFLAGLHRRGDSQLYVSRGTGFWGPPLRVFAPAEITLLTLLPA